MKKSRFYMTTLLLITFILCSSYSSFYYEGTITVGFINSESNDESERRDLKTSVYEDSRMSYGSSVGYCRYYSSGSRIYWDCINHNDVNIKVMAMTGEQFSDAASGPPPYSYYSLRYQGSKGYGYFTVPYAGQWGICFSHEDSSGGTTTLYWNVRSSPSLTVTNPSSGNKWVKKGTTHEITWSYSSIADVTIELWRGSTFIQDITPTYTTCDGSYMWSVPTSLDDASDYRLKITNWVNPNIYDYSSYFEIFEDESIIITSPDSASLLGTGNSCEILWTWKGPMSNIKIELWNNSMFYENITHPSTPCDGVFSWVLPSNLSDGSNYQIKIIDIDDPTICNYSDFFSIYIAIPPMVSIERPSPSIYGPETLLINASISSAHYIISDVKAMINTSTPLEITMNQGAGNYWSCQWDNVSDYTSGYYNISIYAIDTANNLNHTEFVILTIDSDPPDVTIESPLPAIYNQPSLLINVSITDAFSNITEVKVLINSSIPLTLTMNQGVGNYWDCYWNNLSMYPSGIYKITIFSYDDMGNLNQTQFVIITVYHGPEGGAILGYDLFILIGILSLASVLYIRKRYKVNSLK